MQPSDARFSLRFESGDREGDLLALTPGVLTLGRKPGNQVVLAHSSVSGKHAELRVEANGVELVDLGSTNGTRVGADKIDRARLAHGDRISVGQIELTLLDREVAGDVSSPALASPSAGSTAGEGLGAISAERLQATGKKSSIGLLIPLALLLAAGGGAAWWFTRGGGADGGGKAAAGVAEVTGNQLAHGTFESDDASSWITTDASTGVVELDRSFASTGATGLGAALESGEWFVARSEAFPARARAALSVQAELSADGGRGRLGLELSRDDGGRPIVIWSRATSSADFGTFEFGVPGTSGYETGTVLFAGVGPGVLALDNVVVLQGEAPATARFGEYTVDLFGETTSAMVSRSGTPLIPRVQVDPWRAGANSSAGTAVLAAVANATGFTFSLRGSATTIELVYASDSIERVATVGPEGYRGHLNEFSVESCDAVLLGWGIDLARVGFPQPVKLSGERRDGELILRIDANDLSEFDLRFDFQSDRAEARGLSARATEADRGGRYGEALRGWSQLLATYPYEKDLIESAETGRVQRVGAGFAELETLREEFERARFFELEELFREGAEQARTIVTSYDGSEVAAAADTLASEIDAARQKLTGGDEQNNKLERILASDAAKSAPEWSAHLAEEANASKDG